MKKNTKIYNDAVDKNVAVNVVYGKTIEVGISQAQPGDVYVAYHDEEFTQPVKLEELKNLYFKGAVVFLLDPEGHFTIGTPFKYSFYRYNSIGHQVRKIVPCLYALSGYVITDPDEVAE